MKLSARNLNKSRHWLRTGFALLGPLLLAGVCRAGTDKATGAKPSPKPAATPGRFEIPLPVGHDAEGVHIPMFQSGKRQMEFWIKKAYRVDMDHLDMTDAFLQTYDEKGVPDIAVFLTRSMLDLNTRVVTSEVPATVERADFEIVGQNMVFNTITHKGGMSGHVHTVIYNRQEAGGSSPTPSPATSPGGDSAPTPAPQPSATP